MQAKLAIIYLQLVYTDFPALLVAQLFKRYLQLQTPKRPVFTELHPYNWLLLDVLQVIKFSLFCFCAWDAPA